MSDRPGLIFLHIPKTGGLTLRGILRRQFTPSETYVARVVENADSPYRRYLLGKGPLPPPPEDPNQQHLARLQDLDDDAVAGLGVFMGHFWFGVHRSIPKPCTYLTVVRDPVDRVLSLYQHRVERHGVTASIEEYVDRAFDVQVDNHQTRLLAGPGAEARRGPCTAETLGLAKEHVERSFAVCGITERFDESLLLVARTFGWRDVRYVRENTSAGRRPRREDLPPHVVERIVELNACDAELHAWAAQRLAGRLDGWPDLPEALARFRRENARFQRRGGKPPLVHRVVGKVRRTLRSP